MTSARNLQRFPPPMFGLCEGGEWLDKWCEDNEIISGGFWIKECSNCHEDMYYGEPYFCPNCGADMREES